MAQINIVTGYTGEAHVKSEEDAALNAFLMGDGVATLSVTEEHTNDSISITLEALIAGRFVKTDTTQTFPLTPPSSGYKRADAIFVAYCKTLEGIESAHLIYEVGTPVSTGTPIPPTDPTTPSGTTMQMNYLLYEIIWSNSQEISSIVGASETIPYTDRLDIYRVYNAGQSDSTNVGSITANRFPLNGGKSLVVGKAALLPSAPSLEGNKTYGYEIKHYDGSDFDGTVIAGGVQISAGDWNAMQTYNSVGQDKIRVGIKPSVNVAASSVTISFWYVSI